MQLTIEKHLQVPMRDGVLLATDVYRPAGAGPFPVVMMRLPYNKEQPVLLFLAGDILRVAQAGYAVVLAGRRLELLHTAAVEAGARALAVQAGAFVVASAGVVGSRAPQTASVLIVMTVFRNTPGR
jgi:hypothetical protein